MIALGEGFRIAKNGNVIQSVEDWLRFASPAGGSDQWVEGVIATFG